MNKTHKYFIKKQLNQQQPPNNSAPTTPRVDQCSSQRDIKVIERNLCTELHINGTRINSVSKPTHAPVVAMLSQRLDASLPISLSHHATDEQQLLRRRRTAAAAAASSDDPIIIQVSPCEFAGNLLLLLLVSFAGYFRPRNFYNHNQIVDDKEDTKTKTLHTKLVNSYVLGIAFAFFCVCPVQGGIIINNYLWVSFRWQGCGPRTSFPAAACRSWQRLPSRPSRVDWIS